MTPTLRRKLEALAERREEIERLLSDPGVIADADRFRKLSREFSQLEPVAHALADEAAARHDLAAAEAMRGDAEMRELAEEEIASAQARLQQLDAQLLAHLIPRDPRDEADIYLEVRAGTGGDEAAIFAGDLFRMYARYAERQGWKVEVESASPGEHGGYKEVIARIEGRGAYSRLKFESGTHRVQRVPETESQGRIHTSAATVAIIPVEADGEPIRHAVEVEGLVALLPGRAADGLARPGRHEQLRLHARHGDVGDGGHADGEDAVLYPEHVRIELGALVEGAHVVHQPVEGDLAALRHRGAHGDDVVELEVALRRDADPELQRLGVAGADHAADFAARVSVHGPPPMM